MSTPARRRPAATLADRSEAVVQRQGPWTIHVPNWHPTRLNQLIGCNRFVAAGRKKRDRAMIATWTFATRTPPATGKRRVCLTITLGPCQRAADPDAYWKSLLDALVKCRLLKDDNRQWVELTPVEFDRGPQKCTTITLEDIS